MDAHEKLTKKSPVLTRDFLITHRHYTLHGLLHYEIRVL